MWVCWLVDWKGKKIEFLYENAFLSVEICIILMHSFFFFFVIFFFMEIHIFFLNRLKSGCANGNRKFSKQKQKKKTQNEMIGTV